MSDPKAQPVIHSAYFQLTTRDTTGKQQTLYAAYQNGQFVLFEIQGDLAQVMYLMAVPTPQEISRIVALRIIDVTDSKALGERPAFSAARLSASHPWSPVEQAAVGTLLETKNVRLDTPGPGPGPGKV